MALNIGDKMPKFKGETLEGAISSNDLKGENVILYFYPRDSTPGCTTEACDFRDNFSDFKRAKIKVYGISKDSLASHQKFSDRNELSFPLISDTDGSICEAFGVWQKKKMAGSEYMGIVRTTFFIDKKGTIRKIWDKVKVKEHVIDVLEQIKPLVK